ncbi:MAG: gamma-glutamyltransferase [Cellvibrionaceae bacterium]|nr:gamma-glutamyltransferase [Cellvibrionaceae bacterium]
MTRLLRFTLLLTLLCTGACARQTVVEDVPHSYAAVYGDNKGAIASVNPLATQAGLAAFAAGGNAIDAAIAVAFTLGVVDGHNSGIGGGCFVLVRLADGRVLAIDGREMAPAAVTREIYLDNGKVIPGLSKTGALAVGIPGSVAAYHQLQQLGGRLDWRQVILPAAQLAERGFAIDGTLALRLQRTKDDLARFPDSAAIYLLPNGDTPAAGHVLRQADLAVSYRALAQRGPDWFYRGDFATRTEAWMRANGGLITREDFSAYTTRVREPLVTHFNDFEIYGFPTPSSGGIHVAQMLSMLEPQPLADLTPVDFYHRLAETMRLAFADRAHWLGDADHVPVPAGLLDADYLRARAAGINPERAAGDVTYGIPPDAEALFNKHTTHIATADAEGNWVAITATVNTSFGSKVVVPGTGVLLNNQMDDFSLDPGAPNAFGLVGAHANSVAPGKRPLSSMSPTLVTREGKPVMTLGAAGGPTIISQVTQVLLRYLAMGQTLEQAMEAVRIHHQWSPNLLFVESTMPEEVREGLRAKGHELKEMGSFGGTQAIVLEEGKFLPMTEPRVIQRNREVASP